MTTATEGATTTMTTDASSTLLTPDQAAAMISVKAHTLADWRRAGVGPAYLRLSERKYRYRKSAVVAYLAAIEHDPGLADSA